MGGDTGIATVLGNTCRVRTGIRTVLEATCIQSQGTRTIFLRRGDILHDPRLLPPLIYRNTDMNISQASLKTQPEEQNSPGENVKGSPEAMVTTQGPSDWGWVDWKE